MWWFDPIFLRTTLIAIWAFALLCDCSISWTFSTCFFKTSLSEKLLSQIQQMCVLIHFFENNSYCNLGFFLGGGWIVSYWFQKLSWCIIVTSDAIFHHLYSCRTIRICNKNRTAFLPILPFYRGLNYWPLLYRLPNYWPLIHWPLIYSWVLEVWDVELERANSFMYYVYF